jgi:hypothetical protein
MNEVDSSCDAYSHRKPSQMGGNHWLLRVYMHDNVGMTWLVSEYIFRGHMCHWLLSIYGQKNIRIT